MIRYRPFRNTDPRALAEIWRSQPRQRGLVSSMTPALLERMVFSKPYFDRLGLIIAENADGPVGFAHAGFGPDPTRQSLSTRVGVVCLIMIAPHAADDGIADELLARAEAYLRQRGAELTYGGGYDPWAPFYRGLYGGALPPGVLDSDSVLRDALCRGGYAPVAHRLIFQQVLPRFRPLVDRHQMLIRRRYTVEADPDPRAADWWEACMYAQNDRTRFTLSARQGAEPLARLTWWDLEPLASSWGVHAAGLAELVVDPGHRRQGLATYLVGEALRQLSSHGVTLAELHADQDDEPLLGLYRKLGFEQIDRGVVFRKPA